MTQEPDELVLTEEVEEEEVPIAYDIATYPSDFTLSIIHKMWHEGDIQIPEFQRQFVWTIEQSSLLIDSFLAGLPVPPVFFYIDEENKNLVIDGQQRILSTVYFIDGYFGEESKQGKKQVFRLAGLSEKSPRHNLRFQDLTESDRRKLNNAVLRAINVRQLSPNKDITSIYHIFARLNTGGTALKPQEIRNCVFRGGFSRLLRRLNENEDWRTILGRKSVDKHQRDIELILRLFALSRKWQSYERPMKEHLNVAMRRNRSGATPEAKRFESRFPRACGRIVRELGDRPFHLRGPLNSSVLDSTFTIFMDNLDSLPDDVAPRFRRLVQNPEFVEGTLTSTTDTKVLRGRFQAARTVLLS